MMEQNATNERATGPNDSENNGLPGGISTNDILLGHGNGPQGSLDHARFPKFVRNCAPFFCNANGWTEEERICQEIMRRAGIEGQRFLVRRDGMWVPADLEAIRRFVRHQLEHYSQDPQVIAKAEALQERSVMNSWAIFHFLE